jgi:hypothetical protein
MASTMNNGVILTVRRTNGVVEEVVREDCPCPIPADTYAAMVAATRNAGRGEILSQRPNVVPMPLEWQREEIAARLIELSEQFPTAARVSARAAVEAELNAFDAAHPEVLAGIRGAVDQDAVVRMSRMED